MIPEIADEAIFSLLTTDRAHRQAIDATLQGLGLHRSQHLALMFLSRQETPPTQVDLARYFHVSPAAVTVTLKKLEQAGYVERKACEGNARANFIFLSDTGRNILNQSIELFRQVDAAMIEGISQEDMSTLLRCTKIMKNNLHKCFGDEAQEGVISDNEEMV